MWRTPVHWSYVCRVDCRKGPTRIGVPFKPLTLLLGLTVPTALSSCVMGTYVLFLNLYLSLSHVCFPEFTFQEITFQTFLCLFAIRKVGQRKTLSGQRKILFGQQKILSSQWKHFPIKEKFGLVSRKVFFLLAVFVFRKAFLCLFAIRKVG